MEPAQAQTRLLGVWTRNSVTTRVNIGDYCVLTRNNTRNNPLESRHRTRNSGWRRGRLKVGNLTQSRQGAARRAATKRNALTAKEEFLGQDEQDGEWIF
jgi:hypothetical protein